MRSITYSAPLYVIIADEGIPYGKPALGIAIEPKVEFTLNEGTENDFKKNKFIEEILDNTKQYLIKINKWNSRKFSYSYTIPLNESECSLSLLVAVVSATLELFTEVQYSQEDINKISYDIAKKMKMDMYGCETSTVTFGGLVYYRKEFEFLKGIYQLPFKIPAHIARCLSILPINSSPKNFNFSKKTAHLLDLQEKYLKRFVISTIKEDSSFFNETVKENLVNLLAMNVLSIEARKVQLKLKKNQISIVAETLYHRNSLLLIYSQEISQLKIPNCIPFQPSTLGVVKIH